MRKHLRSCIAIVAIMVVGLIVMEVHYTSSKMIINPKDIKNAKCLCDIEYDGELVALEHFYNKKRYYDVICKKDGVMMKDLALPPHESVHLVDCK